MTRLTRELFERSRDDYFQAMVAATEGKSARDVPEVGLEVCLGLVESVLPSSGLKRAVKKWRRGIVERLGVAYIVATTETWEELDRGHCRALLQETLRAARSTATGRQATATDVANIPLPNRIEATLRGLGSDVPEAAALREYVFSQGAYRRLDYFADTMIGIGRVMDGVKPREVEAYNAVARFAWEQGLHLGLLEVIDAVQDSDVPTVRADNEDSDAPRRESDDPEDDYPILLLLTLAEMPEDERPWPEWAAWRACAESTALYHGVLDETGRRLREEAEADEPGPYDDYLEELIFARGLEDVVERLLSDIFSE